MGRPALPQGGSWSSARGVEGGSALTPMRSAGRESRPAPTLLRYGSNRQLEGMGNTSLGRTVRQSGRQQRARRDPAPVSPGRRRKPAPDAIQRSCVVSTHPNRQRCREVSQPLPGIAGEALLQQNCRGCRSNRLPARSTGQGATGPAQGACPPHLPWVCTHKSQEDKKAPFVKMTSRQWKKQRSILQVQLPGSDAGSPPTLSPCA